MTLLTLLTLWILWILWIPVTLWRSVTGRADTLYLAPQAARLLRWARPTPPPAYLGEPP